MSSEVWNIAQNTSAQDMYDIYSQKLMFRSELMGLRQITSMCNDMVADFDSVIQDQNNYIIEFDELETDFTNKKASIQDEIKRLLAEIKVLEQKDQNGTITEDEAKELADKKATFNELYSSLNQQQESNTAALNTKKSEIKDKFGKKEKIASDYGNLAVEKGSEFVDGELKQKLENKESINPFKFAGKFGRHFAGTAAVTAGTNLLDKVEESSLIDKSLSSKKIK